MKVAVHYYAAARELAGCEAATFEFPGPILAQAALRDALAKRHPSIAGFLARMRLAVNGDFVDDSQVIRNGDRVDVLPPVAGGAPVMLCEIVDHELSLDQARRAVSHSSAGGVCLFLGVVRDHADGKRVARLDYEAHESLAREEMERVLQRVAAAHPGARLAAVHRVGELAVGDAAVVVAASAPHRAEAFAACRAAIDEIKETVPVWKKEWDPEGGANWVNLA
ncbi:MAG: molybdenum cofactor biosynthesis protein MoaE [Polyangiales bacterium]